MTDGQEKDVLLFSHVGCHSQYSTANDELKTQDFSYFCKARLPAQPVRPELQTPDLCEEELPSAEWQKQR